MEAAAAELEAATFAQDEFVLQADPNLVVGRLEDITLISGSAKSITPAQLRLNKRVKPVFTFGRSESLAEDALRGIPGGTSEYQLGMHVRTVPGAPGPRRPSGVNFQETFEYVVEEVAPACEVSPEEAEDRRTAFHSPLEVATVQQLRLLFERLDLDGSQSVSMHEAVAFWSKGFSKISAAAMFREVDTDGDGTITLDEYISFWQQVKSSGYTDAEIVEELRQMLDGGMWVDWRDGKSTGQG